MATFNVKTRIVGSLGTARGLPAGCRCLPGARLEFKQCPDYELVLRDLVG